MEVFMKNRIKLFGIIAFAAMLAFSLVFLSCGDGAGGGSSGSAPTGGGANKTLIATINVTNPSGVYSGYFGIISEYLGEPLPTTFEEMGGLKGKIVGEIDGKTPIINVYGYGTSTQKLNGRYSFDLHPTGTLRWRWWGDIQFTNGNATIDWNAPNVQSHDTGWQ